MQQFVTSTGFTSERPGGPRLCVECGLCESRCPQHLEIVKSLALVRRRMEPLWVRGIAAAARAFLGKKRRQGQGL
jgi:predicted aldo/keto reductase-like oxidoreductase